MSPEELITCLLSDRTPDLKIATNLFRGPTRPPKKGTIPHCAVFVLGSGGLEPRYCHGDDDLRALLVCFVQIRIRGCIGEYSAGRELADRVMKALQKRVEHPGVVFIEPRESSPYYMGRDKTEHDEWVINVSVTIDNEIGETNKWQQH